MCPTDAFVLFNEASHLTAVVGTAAAFACLPVLLETPLQSAVSSVSAAGLSVRGQCSGSVTGVRVCTSIADSVADWMDEPPIAMLALLTVLRGDFKLLLRCSICAYVTIVRQG